MKTCFKCGEAKPLSDFYKHKMMADGHLNKCKDCTMRDVRENRSKNIDHYKQYEKQRYRNDPRKIASLKKYAESEKGKIAISVAGRRYRERNPIKRGVHAMTRNAMRDGKISKMPCEVCGCEKVHAHHDDYAKPLDVRWLCALHHSQWHSKHGEGANAS